MKCIQCDKQFYSGGILVSSDGDFVCSERCKEAFITSEKEFMDTVVNDPIKFKEWLTSKK